MQLYDGCIGLICWVPTLNRYRQLPLTKVHADATLFDLTAQVTVTQTFTNITDSVTEAIYVFPLDEAAAVTGFEAHINGRVIKAVVKTKSDAQKTYDTAVSEGKHAFLLQEERADIFRMSVGNLGPHESVSIVISYVTELALDTSRARFFLPTAVAPRYTPANTVAAPQGDALQPYLVDVNVQAKMSSDILSVSSPTHSIETTTEGRSCRVRLATNGSAMDKDFVLLVSAQHLLRPSVLAYQDPATGVTTAALSMVMNADNRQVPSELIFVVDCSGSMQGDRIAHACQALNLLLRSIPVGCHFNIVRFGSSFEMWRPSSVAYDDDTLESATQYANATSANLGGTEILQPLRAIFDKPLIPGLKRQLFLLTDGQVSNEQAVIELVRRNNASSRVFALGIGDGVSHHLVSGVARAGRGTARFITNNEMLRAKVLEQLSVALQAQLTDVHITWADPNASVGAGDAAQKPANVLNVGSAVKSVITTARSFFSEDKAASDVKAHVEPPAEGNIAELFPPKAGQVVQAPLSVPPILQNNRFIVYAFYGPGTPMPAAIKVSASSPDGPLEIELPFKLTTDGAAAFLPSLAAKALIQELQDGRQTSRYESNVANVRKDVTALGLRFNLSSEYTAFVAVDEQSRPVNVFRRPEPPQMQPMMMLRGGGGPRLMMAKGAAPMAMAAPAPAFAMAAPPPPPPSGAMYADAAPPPAPSKRLSKKKESAAPMMEFSRNMAVADAMDMDEDLAPEAAAPSHANVVMSLIMIQRASGSVQSVDALCKAVKTTPADLRKALEAVHSGASDADLLVFATLVWCAVLAEHFAGNRVEWELAVDKATRWCSAQNAASDAWKDAAAAFARTVTPF